MFKSLHREPRTRDNPQEDTLLASTHLTALPQTGQDVNDDSSLGERATSFLVDVCLSEGPQESCGFNNLPKTGSFPCDPDTGLKWEELLWIWEVATQYKAGSFLRSARWALLTSSSSAQRPPLRNKFRALGTVDKTPSRTSKG